MNESGPFSLTRLNYFMHKNPLLFSSLLVESNVLILTYPLQTLKTRIMSRHKAYDLCHFLKNKVEKARKIAFTLAIHYGIMNAYGHLLVTSSTHYFTSKYFDFMLLTKAKINSYISRKILSYVGTYFDHSSC